MVTNLKKLMTLFQKLKIFVDPISKIFKNFFLQVSLKKNLSRIEKSECFICKVPADNKA